MYNLENPWSVEENMLLRNLWEAVPQMSTVEIGRRMGRSKYSVIGRANRMRLTPRTSPIKRVITSPVWQARVNRRIELEDLFPRDGVTGREALPVGHPDTWALITQGTSIAGVPFSAIGVQ